jgi:hypothetical protein
MWSLITVFYASAALNNGQHSQMMAPLMLMNLPSPLTVHAFQSAQTKQSTAGRFLS